MGRSITQLPSGIKSVQTGIVSGTMATGSGDYLRYYDTTINAVDPSKSIIYVAGGCSASGAEYALYNSGSSIAQSIFASLTSSTNLRIYNPAITGTTAVKAKWTVIEYY